MLSLQPRSGESAAWPPQATAPSPSRSDHSNDANAAADCPRHARNAVGPSNVGAPLLDAIAPSDLPDASPPANSCQALITKIFYFPEIRICRIVRTSRLDCGGAYRDRHD